MRVLVLLDLLAYAETGFFIVNPLARIRLIIEKILVDRPCAMGVEFSFPGSLLSTFLCGRGIRVQARAVGSAGAQAPIFQALSPGSQGQNLAVTVVCVPISLESGQDCSAHRHSVGNEVVWA